MYIISELTGKIYLNGLEIPLDDSKQEFKQYYINNISYANKKPT